MRKEGKARLLHLFIFLKKPCSLCKSSVSFLWVLYISPVVCIFLDKLPHYSQQTLFQASEENSKVTEMCCRDEDSLKRICTEIHSMSVVLRYFSQLCERDILERVVYPQERMVYVVVSCTFLSFNVGLLLTKYTLCLCSSYLA